MHTNELSARPFNKNSTQPVEDRREKTCAVACVLRGRPRRTNPRSCLKSTLAHRGAARRLLCTPVNLKNGLKAARRFRRRSPFLQRATRNICTPVSVTAGMSEDSFFAAWRGDADQGSEDVYSITSFYYDQVDEICKTYTRYHDLYRELSALSHEALEKDPYENGLVLEAEDLDRLILVSKSFCVAAAVMLGLEHCAYYMSANTVWDLYNEASDNPNRDHDMVEYLKRHYAHTMDIEVWSMHPSENYGHAAKVCWRLLALCKPPKAALVARICTQTLPAEYQAGFYNKLVSYVGHLFDDALTQALQALPVTPTTVAALEAMQTRRARDARRAQEIRRLQLVSWNRTHQALTPTAATAAKQRRRIAPWDRRRPAPKPNPGAASTAQSQSNRAAGYAAARKK